MTWNSSNEIRQGQTETEDMHRIIRRTLLAMSALLSAAFLVTASMPASATEQAQERQDARGTRQEARQDGRDEKIDCRLENNKSNAACRQDNRDTKQKGREDARDARQGGG